jgi:hypothetical protein
VSFSDFRGEIIKSHDKNAILIGPYIHYVDPVDDHYASDDYFLVMLTHSAKGINLRARFNVENHVSSLEKKFGMKSLLLIHPNDLNLVQEYGLDYTTCGFMEDKYFLHRLKRLILDSSFVVTDFIGTHIGYIIYLNRKIYVMKEAMTYDGSEENVKKEFGARVVEELYMDQLAKLKNEFLPEEFISSDVFYQLVSEYWGFKHIKSNCK